MEKWHAKLLALILLLPTAITVNAASKSENVHTQCKALISDQFLQLQDAPTRVSSAVLVEQSGKTPAHCLVEGYIVPQVGFALKLPVEAHWNGKLFHQGVGGFVGHVYEQWCDTWLKQGYACITTDAGHKGTDTAWQFNNTQALIDFGYRAIHVTTLAGKALTNAYYSKAPSYTYFMGCSGGGRQALIAASRFPDDFDGIIAMDPAFKGSKLLAATNWHAQAFTDEDGQPLFSKDDLAYLHKEVLQQCDMDDGLKDGVVGNPPACHVKLQNLACKRGQTQQCLTSVQINAARKLYSGPMSSTGYRQYVGSVMPGTEESWYAMVGLGTAMLQNFMFFPPGPGFSWNYRDFDHDNDWRRLDMMEGMLGDGVTDLRPFHNKGGKLMLVQGWDDSGSPLPLHSIDTYEMVERIVGGRAKTQEFFRLFMMPGRTHCGRGPGAHAFDFVGVLDKWVSEGMAPEYIVGAHIKDDVKKFELAPDPSLYTTFPESESDIAFTRPVYPYPLRAIYKGKGDPNDWRSFKPVEAPVDWEALRKWRDELWSSYRGKN